jgi:hypothetical protein
VGSGDERRDMVGQRGLWRLACHDSDGWGSHGHGAWVELGVQGQDLEGSVCFREQ